MKLGIAGKKIQERISKWVPAKLRGEIIKTENRTYFADCYNASLVSFLDSLKHFDRLFPAGGRLFVIGTLKDKAMGDAAAGGNDSVCKNLPIRENDGVIIIGEGADELRSAVKCRNAWFLQSTNEAGKIVKNFSGIVYIKGHHDYNLKDLIF
jgi:UDP-N-acetylmuramyl pentapeptide synthase